MFQASVSVGTYKCPTSSDTPGFQIADSSNYGSNTTPGHEFSDFESYFVVFVNFPDGSQYVIGTTAAAPSADITLQTPYNSNPLVNVIPPNVINQNGTYSFLMVVIPDFDATEDYPQGVLVYSAGSIYRSIVPSPLANLLDPTQWEVVLSEDIFSAPENYSSYTSQSTQVVNCDFVPSIPFGASLLDKDNLLDISIDGRCDLVTFVDHSNYDTNTEPSHSLENFTGFRQIKLTAPDGSEFLISTEIDGITPDVVINPAASGEYSMQWDIPDSIKDGRFEVCFCSVPEWNNTSYFPGSTPTLEVIVFHSGLIWKSLNDTIGSEPSEESEDWELFEGDLCNTRYCFNANFVITCRVIDKCYKDAVVKANCGQVDCCDDDLCRNPHLLKATGLLLIKQEIPWAVARKDWNRVDALVNAALNKCSC